MNPNNNDIHEMNDLCRLFIKLCYGKTNCDDDIYNLCKNLNSGNVTKHSKTKKLT